MKNLELTQKEDITIVKIDESLSQNDYLSMRDFFKEDVFGKGHRNIVLDCDAVSSLPSIAFGTFCSLSRDAKRLGGQCVLIHVCEAIFGIMKKTHANRIVTVLSSFAEAKKQFS